MEKIENWSISIVRTSNELTNDEREQKLSIVSCDWSGTSLDMVRGALKYTHPKYTHTSDIIRMELCTGNWLFVMQKLWLLTNWTNGFEWIFVCIPHVFYRHLIHSILRHADCRLRIAYDLKWSPARRISIACCRNQLATTDRSELAWVASFFMHIFALTLTNHCASSILMNGISSTFLDMVIIKTVIVRIECIA